MNAPHEFNDDERAAAFDATWAALEHIARAVDDRRERRPDLITPVRLARELGHRDGGSAIRKFLRNPDDGGELFNHSRLQHWHLSVADAQRVRRRFRPLPKPTHLSDREREAVSLYTTGSTVNAVATVMSVKPESVRTYLRRARDKIRSTGAAATTRADLRRYLDSGSSDSTDSGTID